MQSHIIRKFRSPSIICYGTSAAGLVYHCGKSSVSPVYFWGGFGSFVSHGLITLLKPQSADYRGTLEISERSGTARTVPEVLEGSNGTLSRCFNR